MKGLRHIPVRLVYADYFASTFKAIDDYYNRK